MRTSIRSRSPRPRTRSGRVAAAAVVAEQLAPYLALPPSENADDIIEEGYVLPVVAALDGRATVDDETGAIVYVFDDLVRGATASTSSNEGALAEKDIQFSNASQGQLAAAGVLGVANLRRSSCCRVLLNRRRDPRRRRVAGPGWTCCLAGRRRAFPPTPWRSTLYQRARGPLRARGEGRWRSGICDAKRCALVWSGRLVVYARSSPPRASRRGSWGGRRRRLGLLDRRRRGKKLERARVADDLAAFDDALRARDDAEQAMTIVGSIGRGSRAASSQVFSCILPSDHPRRLLRVLRPSKPIAGRGRFLKPHGPEASQSSALPTHRAASKNYTHTHTTKQWALKLLPKQVPRYLPKLLVTCALGCHPGPACYYAHPLLWAQQQRRPRRHQNPFMFM